jgi:hypothetical protein
MGHGRRSLLALREEFFGFKDLRSLKMSQFHGKLFNGGSDDRQSSEELSVVVSLDDLG